MNNISNIAAAIKSFYFLFYIVFILSASASASASDMDFKGFLLDRPCQIDPSTISQDVVFMDTAVPLYQIWPGKSYEKKFQIKLINCHVNTIGKVVELVFKGKEEKMLPGYLEVNGVNKGKLGIGIIDIDGFSLLKLNEIHNNRQGNQVGDSSITFNFKAFVQATGDAILNKSIQAGAYDSTATFILSYK
ncbi:fimbrial protein [Escherichia coli]|uniref:fimbrial protein n=1 Tax=Escherichia coli TaxID=562 RepID=UPI001101AED8|nr:fimbrial protein [Escherichia coli]MBB9841413.1 type 1 fimbrial protein [Escherichia coli]MDY8675742.1 fimbrial protein [Escherichia coli]MDY9703679.1 fimbrial protein [Escherichia coli]TFN99969.1 type 1 fimbrial protein [Escherichia coli]TFO02930.1 type 1 fimbrial protein [Escherichia coli]